MLFLNLTAFSTTGGIERFNKCFLKALDDLDANYGNVSSSYSAYDDLPLETYYSPEKYKGFRKNKLLFVVKSIVKARLSDVIILGHVNLALPGLIIKKLYPKKKLVLITHGIDVWSELGGVKKKVLHAADSILSVSSFTKRKVVEVNKVDPDKITLFPNTLDPYFSIPSEVIKQQPELRRRYGIADDEFVFYTLSRLSSTELFKGYDNVIKALAEVVKERPDVKYVIGGKYDTQEKNRIEKLVADNQLQGKVVLTGFLEEQELVAHYQMADAYIMPSKKEGFGIVYIEALACGTPVIAGNADGSVDALLDGATGTLIDPDNISEIRNAMIDHVDSPVDVEKRKQRKKATLDAFTFDKYKQRLKSFLASS